ncbi:hypothetical protein BG011_006415 [Mortierella polycephala]|uniref:FAD-binding domain-containing protein n=1 Tax=Mortierella polycephala TaxID=41804 RepID=A0A9P6PW58_9FUNG|nr:hypothetical protein BG011_006415 [Mortierella polycephala]
MAQAGYDAVVLANVLYAHSLDPSQDIAKGLRSYEAARRAEAKFAVESSHWFGGFLSRQNWIGKWMRYVVLNYLPRFLLYKLSDRLNSDRAQANFLPRAI